MRVGKVPPASLRSLVYPYLGRREDVLVHAGIGEDCSVVAFGEQACVLTTDPITGAGRHRARLAVVVATNDLAATGAEPIGVLMTVLLHPGATEADLAGLMREAGEQASRLGIEILGGHTEVTPGIDRTILSLTALGRAPAGRVLHAGAARPGDALLATKAAAIEGTAILAADFADALRGLVGEAILARAARFFDDLSVMPEGRIAALSGARAMHDATEGGVVAAALEAAEASGVGVELWADAVPVRLETQVIADAAGVDPLRLISSGMMLIAAPDPERTAAALRDAGIPVAQIGRFTAGDRTLARGGAVEPLVAPERDALWDAIEALSPAR